MVAEELQSVSLVSPAEVVARHLEKQLSSEVARKRKQAQSLLEPLLVLWLARASGLRQISFVAPSMPRDPLEGRERGTRWNVLLCRVPGILSKAYFADLFRCSQPLLRLVAKAASVVQGLSRSTFVQ